MKVKSQVLLRAGPVRPLKERGGSGIGWRPDQEAAYGEAEARGWDATAQLDAMDREGVDLDRALPDARAVRARPRLDASRSAPTASSPRSPPRSRAPTTTGCTTSASSRPTGSSAPRWCAPHDIAGAVDETRRCVEEYGFKAIYLAPGSREPPALAPPRLRSALGGVPEAGHRRSASTAAVARCSRPTSASRSSATG